MVLFIIENIGFGGATNGVGAGGLSVSFAGRFGVAAGRSLVDVALDVSVVATGDGETIAPEPGGGDEYRLFVSLEPPRVMNHAIRTPEAAKTRTIANTQGNALVRDSIRFPSGPRFGNCSGRDVMVDCAVGIAGLGLAAVGPGDGRFHVAFESNADPSRVSLLPSSRQNTSDSSSYVLRQVGQIFICAYADSLRYWMFIGTQILLSCSLTEPQNYRQSRR